MTSLFEGGALPERFSRDRLAECAEREVKQRVRVYPRLVAERRMTQEMADREIAMMKAIVEILRMVPSP